MRRSAILACALALLPGFASADDVFLKSGGKLSGRILSRTDTAVAVDVGPGTITVPMTSVLRIEERRSVIDEYYERAQKLAARDASAWVALGKWASSEGLGTQARQAYDHAVAADPLNADANRALGRVQLDGRWVNEAESYRARGYVQFEGEWMTPAERDATLTRRDAAMQAEWARLDAERRVWEAEARAAEAEARAQQAEAATQGYVGYPLGWGAYSWGGGSWPNRRFKRGPEQGEWPFPSLGTWPTGPLGTWPSQSLGPWPSPPGGRPPSNRHVSPGPRPSPPPASRPPQAGPRPRSAPKPAPPPR